MRKKNWHLVISLALTVALFWIFFSHEDKVIHSIWLWRISGVVGGLSFIWFVYTMHAFLEDDRDYSVVTCLRRCNTSSESPTSGERLSSPWTPAEVRSLGRLAEGKAYWKSDHEEYVILHGKFTEEELTKRLMHFEFEIIYTADQKSLPVTPDPLFELDPPDDPMDTFHGQTCKTAKES